MVNQKFLKQKIRKYEIKYMKLTVKAFFLFVLMFFFLSNCGDGIFGSFSWEGLSTLEDIDDDSRNIPNDEFFYVKLEDAILRGGPEFKPLDYVMYARGQRGIDFDCKIPKDQVSATEDLYCMLEILEGDLYYNDLYLEYNIPPDMCDYLFFETHWHYNKRSGIGPVQIIRKECVSSVVGDDTTSSTQDIYCPSIAGLPADGAGCSAFTGLGCKQEVRQLCDYVTDNDNCCMGSYEIVRAEGTGAPTVEEQGDWGGDLRNCIGGLARTTNWPLDSNGFPVIQITRSLRSGYRRTYRVPSVYSKYNTLPGFNFITANYWDGIEENTDQPVFYRSDESPPQNHYVLPRFGNPYITWSCKDEGHDVTHRIHLIIREWNTLEEFLVFKESGGNSGDPDVDGDEGIVCDYYAQDQDLLYDAKDDKCNDAWDVDDWQKGTDSRIDIYRRTGDYRSYPYIPYK